MKDFHLHTNMSDGTDSPIELLAKVVDKGCNAFSVTDHDDLRANKTILKYLNLNSLPIKFFTGVEISSFFKGKDLHLLCHKFDINSPNVKEIIDKAANLRRQRIIAVIEELPKKHGVTIPEEDKIEILSHEIPSRVHIALVMKKMAFNGSVSEIIKKYLNLGEIRKFKIPAEKVIKNFTLAGGLVTVAHPIEIQKKYNLDFEEIAVIMKELKNIGLTGIEVFHSSHGQSEIREYSKIAKECNLLVSGGSDYHGKNKNVEIGQLSNFYYVPTDEEITIDNVLSNKEEKDYEIC